MNPPPFCQKISVFSDKVFSDWPRLPPFRKIVKKQVFYASPEGEWGGGANLENARKHFLKGGLPWLRMDGGWNCLLRGNVRRQWRQEGLDKGAIPFLPAILFLVWGSLIASRLQPKLLERNATVDTLVVKWGQHWPVVSASHNHNARVVQRYCPHTCTCQPLWAISGLLRSKWWRSYMFEGVETISIAMGRGSIN